MKNTPISNEESKRRIDALWKIAWMPESNEWLAQKVQETLDWLPKEKKEKILKEIEENNK